MREVTSHKVNGLNEKLRIEVLDEPGSGGACHKYRITMMPDVGPEGYFTAMFQNGPIQEAGVNGISQEALLAIVQDRLEGFQSGEFANEDNEAALMHIKCAIAHLHKRTKERMARGVEGTSQK